MTYDEALKYIHGVSNFFCKPGLDRVRELCEAMGNPQKDLRFIHVAGTNGKGSVCSMLSSVLQAAGYRVGLYTSPFVRVFNERMRVNGESIPDRTLVRLTERAKGFAEKMADRPTEFELITAIAFEYFKEEGCDVVVLEVGMGGRHDATNIIDSPLLSIITGVSIDHTAFLGDTVEKIASEKAGIIKEKAPVLFGGENSVAEAVVEAEAKKIQTILYKVDHNSLSVKEISLDGTVFNYRKRENIKISLLGYYQPRNAATVLDAIDILRENGLSVSEAAIYEGLEKAKWQARFEIIGREPLFIFDGAHNPEGVAAAVKSIKGYFGDKRVVIISGVLRDKDYNSIAVSISQVASAVYTITPDNPRALSAVEYAEIYSSRGIKSLPCDSIIDALKKAKVEARSTDTALLCLGSLYTYCEIMYLV